MAKYYAVKVGRKTGIFETWDECKDNVTGYPGALYKSFKNISDAYVYMGWEGTQMSLFDFNKEPENPESDAPFSDLQQAVAYVDGSFNTDTNVFSYGVVMFFNGEEFHLSDNFFDEELSSMRNVAGEIFGSMAAMKFAADKGCLKLTIYHDYEGIAKWPLGLWKATKPGTIAYQKYYNEIKKSLNINFVKVKGHSGDKFNDLADALAKEAAGI